MSRQRSHLVSALVMVVDNLRSPDLVEQRLYELGRRHIGYGVFPTHHYAVSGVLISVVREQ